MRRRDIIVMVGVAASAWTCAGSFAAKNSPVARVGELWLPPFWPKDEDPMLASMAALGWREGENLQLEQRSANFDLARLPRLAADLVALRPDVLVAVGSDETKALQAVTSDIPIVVQVCSDPVGMGFVDSLAHPGRNITGIAITPELLWGKRLDLVMELLGHRPAKVAWLGNPEQLVTKLHLAAVMQSAETMRIEVERLDVREPGDFERVFAATTGCEAILIEFVALTWTNRRQIAELAARHRLPAIYDNRDYVVAGGLISYGWDVREPLRRSASYVDRILKGAQPADLPVEQASRFDLVINLKAANALGLPLPTSLLVRADEVIE
jgi:putative tryptophan/tyrosine transport system substrate-binding protein